MTWAILALTASCIGAATGPEQPAPPRRDLFGTRGEAPASRADSSAVWGTVELSSGERVEGRLSLQGGLALEVFDLEAKEWREIRLVELARLEAKVRSEDLEKEWRWKEAGSDEKVYTGLAYPRRWLDHEVALRDGRRFRGHVRGAVLVLESPHDPRAGSGPTAQGPGGRAPGGTDLRLEKRRFVIRQYERGELGQKLEDLVYVKAIVTGERPAGQPPRAAPAREGSPGTAAPGTSGN